MTSPPHPERTDARLRPAAAAPATTVADRPLRERAHEVLDVPGTARVRAAVRAVAAATVLSLVGVLPWGVVGLSLMALVLLGVTLARVVRLPGALQLALGVTLLGAAWAALLQLYQRWWWLDVVVHLVATGLLTVLAMTLLAGTRLLRAPAPGRQARLGLVGVALAAGLALSVLWELGEWAGHTYLDPAIFVSVTDTIGDVVAGGLGSAVAGWWLAARRTAARPATARPATARPATARRTGA